MTIDPSQTPAIVPATNLDELLGLPHRQFVECAYLTIHNRQADDGGLNHYLRRLRRGESRLALLTEMYGSEEARRSNVRIRWLRGELFRYKISRLPLLRITLWSMSRRQEKAELAYRLAMLEQSISLLNEQSDVRRAAFDEMATLLRAFVQPPKSKLDITSLSAAASEKSLVAGRVLRRLLEAIDEAKVNKS